jgi:hypothetical protein
MANFLTVEDSLQLAAGSSMFRGGAISAKAGTPSTFAQLGFYFATPNSFFSHAFTS